MRETGQDKERHRKIEADSKRDKMRQRDSGVKIERWTGAEKERERIK